MSTWAVLASAYQWRRLPDGATEVRLRDGRRLRCGRGTSPMFDALACGVIEQELTQRFLCDPQCNALWLTLSELNLVEQCNLPRIAPVRMLSAIAKVPATRSKAAKSWLVLLLSFQALNFGTASLALGAQFDVKTSGENLLGNGIGPTWIFLALIAFALHACLHELSHAGMAMSLGVKGRIKFFLHGFWRPRFEAPAQAGLERPGTTAAILASGPLLDLSVQGASLAFLLNGSARPAPFAAAWCVAAVLAGFNLVPLRQTDGNRLLSLAALTPWQRCGYIVISAITGLGAMVLSLRLVGHYLIGGF